MQEELSQLLEERARAVAELAYLKAKMPVHFANRMAKNQSLYFIGCGDAVKIGRSSYPAGRLDALAIGAPGSLTLLADLPGAGDQEADCHKRLQHLHLHGEWFYHTEEVEALIQELRLAYNARG